MDGTSYLFDQVIIACDFYTQETENFEQNILIVREVLLTRNIK